MIGKIDRRLTRSIAAMALILATAGAAQATNITPGFDDIPTGWSVDRYAPHSFTNVGSFAGRNDVLGIEITSAEGLTSRTAGKQTSFFNTQGMKHDVSGSAGDIISADLYVPTAWGNEANGTVRTDIWGVMDDGSGISGYPILGFTNYGGTARFQAWEDTSGAWVDLGVAINFDDWNTLAIEFTGTDTYNFFVNDVLVYTDTTANGSTGYQSIIIQAYNFFDDPAYGDANAVDYTAYWANSSSVAVPEPGALAMIGFAIAAFGVARRRRGMPRG